MPNTIFHSTAFSIFAFVEYFVAGANMFYYWSLACDLPEEEIVVMQPATSRKKMTKTDNISRRQEPEEENNTSNGHVKAVSSPELKKDR